VKRKGGGETVAFLKDEMSNQNQKTFAKGVNTHYTVIMNTLLEIALSAAKAAGDEILTHYESTDFETKKDGSPVTIADTSANEIIIEHLTKTGIAILSEESGTINVPYPSRIWIIDPLDGTKEFINKTGDFCVMIGLLEEGRPILGVVYSPVHDTYYYAEKGTGAYMRKNMNTKRITLSDTTLPTLRCLGSVNNFSPEMAQIAERLGAIKNQRGSLGLKAGDLIENNGDYFFSRGAFGEWDVCAPEIITLEGGGRVTDCFGNPLFYGTENHRLQHGIIFAQPHCYNDVLRVVNEPT
jgi:3'(2'), 5'-bisphosphate nucleotidase